MLRAGAGEPLVLFHPLLSSERIWRRVLPLVAERYDAIAPTALGHRGGAEPQLRPVRVEHLVDHAERQLDELGIDRAHVAGNSLGGWMALELARRGRALSVCALSPAGTWELASPEHSRSMRALHETVSDTKISRPFLPVLSRVGPVRRFAMRGAASHGERLRPAELRDIADDVLGCVARDELIESFEDLPALDPAPCPVTIAWSGADRLLRLNVNGARARQLVPEAHWVVLEDVGHMPMVDDPELVAETILQAASAASAASGR